MVRFENVGKKTMLAQRTRIGLWTATLLTTLAGIVNLLSAVTRGLPNRVHLLKPFFPFEYRANAHIFAALTGFFLLILAMNLLRRKRTAWWVTIALLIVSIFSHLIKGLDIEESLLSAILLGQLLLMRNVFTAQSDRPSIAQGVRVLFAALVFTLVYGTIGFYLLDHNYSIDFNLPQALLQTLAIFFTDDNADLTPKTRFGEFFANSIYTISIITFSYALLMLLRPVLLKSTATARERRRAKAIVEQQGRSSLARFALLEDKSYYFSPSGQSVIAYVAKGRGAIALGDPIGSPDDLREALIGFQLFCSRNDWFPAFYQTLPDYLEIYQSLGFRVLQIGSEAIVDLKTFTLAGKAGKNFRSTINKFTKLGYQVHFYQPPIASDLLKQLRTISDEWLRQMQGAEKKFSLGWFDEEYLRSGEIAAVYAPNGQITAFANIVAEYQLNEITFDLMRHRTQVENGTMDFLFISMLEHFQARGYDSFNLGLAALSGVGQAKTASRLEKAIHYLYEHLNRFYNFQGLYAYKEKFHPCWEARYLIYPNLISLPDVVIALIRADSGDRLLDYFKPGS